MYIITRVIRTAGADWNRLQIYEKTDKNCKFVTQASSKISDKNCMNSGSRLLPTNLQFCIDFPNEDNFSQQSEFGITPDSSNNYISNLCFILIGNRPVGTYADGNALHA